MGSISGINLSSILSALGSSSAGIDVPSAVAQALAAESGPLTQWQQEQALIQSQTGDINQIESDLTALQNALNSLGDPVGALLSMATASSNSSVVTASAAAGSVPGNHVIVVKSLASTASWYSDSVASSSTALAAGSFTLQVGSNAPIQVSIGGSVDTMDQLASYVNGLGAGVTASVVNDSSGSRLAIVSASSGAAGNITISNTTGLNFTQAATGLDASLTVDGIPIDSASNTVTGVVAGVTFNLLSASPGTQVNVSVSPDVTQITQAVTSFVNAYNTVIGDVNQEFTVGANGVQGPLAGDSTLRMLQDQLLGSGSYSGSGSAISTLGGLGITMNDDGTLTLDSGALSSAVQNNFSDVQNFFQGTSSNGFASFLNDQLNTMTDPVSGAFTVDLQSLSSENSDLQSQIDDFQVYLQSEQTRLTDEYNQADTLLQQLPILEQQINAELGNTSNNSNNGG
ncbi:MAG: flagellar filament capping protein FliD [Terriglobales bacterium]